MCSLNNSANSVGRITFRFIYIEDDIQNSPFFQLPTSKSISSFICACPEDIFVVTFNNEDFFKVSLSLIEKTKLFSKYNFVLDENAELKSQYSELNRRFHELEIEYRRLENEREELAAAYKESEAVRVTMKFWN